jgi:hypothetical protein
MINYKNDARRADVQYLLATIHQRTGPDTSAVT